MFSQQWITSSAVLIYVMMDHNPVQNLACRSKKGFYQSIQLEIGWEIWLPAAHEIHAQRWSKAAGPGGLP